MTSNPDTTMKTPKVAPTNVMAKYPRYFMNNTLMPITVVGFGQGGGRVADKFAALTNADKKSTYTTYAFNSNDADFEILQHIPRKNQYSLSIGGLQKNPAEAMKLFAENADLRKKISDFVKTISDVEPQEGKPHILLFIAVLGGGTGTSTILSAVQTYRKEIIEHHVNELLKESRKNINNDALFKKSYKELRERIVKAAKKKFPKIGLVLITPHLNAGADVLKQSVDFIAHLQKEAKEECSNIIFFTYPDNEYFKKQYYDFSEDVRKELVSVYDWSNEQIMSTLHGIFASAGVGGAGATMDISEVMRMLGNGKGSLILSRSEKKVTQDTKDTDIVHQLSTMKGTAVLHEPVPLEVTKEDGKVYANRYTNFGVLGVVDSIATEIDPQGDNLTVLIADQASEDYKVVGAMSPGFLKTANSGNATLYSIMTVDTVPPNIKLLETKYNDIWDSVEAMETNTVEVQVVARRGFTESAITISNSDIDADVFGENPVDDLSFLDDEVEDVDLSFLDDNEDKEDDELDILALMDSLTKNS